MIEEFKGRYDFLSNFAPVSINFNGFIFPTVENAFQASKSTCMDFADKLTSCTPGKSKRLGREVILRADWDDIKLDLMLQLNILKYKNHSYAFQLIHTGNKQLVEGNKWHDNFWGDCRCKKCTNIEGENNLGKILMRIRDIIGGPDAF